MHTRFQFARPTYYSPLNYQSYSPGMYGFQTGYNMVPSSSYHRYNLPLYGSFGYSQVRPGYASTGFNQPSYFSLGYQPGFRQYQTFNFGYQPGFQQYQGSLQPGHQFGLFGNRNLYNTGYQFGYKTGPAYGYQMGHLGNSGLPKRVYNGSRVCFLIPAAIPTGLPIWYAAIPTLRQGIPILRVQSVPSAR